MLKRFNPAMSLAHATTQWNPAAVRIKLWDFDLMRMNTLKQGFELDCIRGIPVGERHVHPTAAASALCGWVSVDSTGGGQHRQASRHANPSNRQYRGAEALLCMNEPDGLWSPANESPGPPGLSLARSQIAFDPAKCAVRHSFNVGVRECRISKASGPRVKHGKFLANPKPCKARS